MHPFMRVGGKMRKATFVFGLALTLAGCVDPVAALNTKYVGQDFVQPKSILIVSSIASEYEEINISFGKEVKRRLNACGVNSEYFYKADDAAGRQKVKAVTDEFKPDVVMRITQSSREFAAMTDNTVVRYGISWSMEAANSRLLWGGDGLLFRNRVTDAPEAVGRKWADDFVDEMIAKTILTRCRGG